MIDVAQKFNRPVRIGVNLGSLDEELLVKTMDDNSKSEESKDAAKEITHEALVGSTLSNARRAEELGMSKNKIILSCKGERSPKEWWQRMRV